MKSKGIFYTTALVASMIMAFASGCASGGYKLTRQYAGWVNSQNVILRVILYILTIPVYMITLLIDVVVFNTMDFWEGRVAAGSYEFKDKEKIYQVRHEILPENGLKRSTIQVFGQDNKKLQEVVLMETASKEIEMYVDGQLRTKVQGLSEIPIAKFYDQNGKLLSEKFIFSDATLAQSAH